MIGEEQIVGSNMVTLMTLLLNGAAGIVCIFREKVLRFLNLIGVGLICPVVVTLHFYLVDLILDYRTALSPEKSMEHMSVLMIVGYVIPTGQTQSKSKPVQEITTSTDSSSQLYQFHYPHTVQVKSAGSYIDYL